MTQQILTEMDDLEAAIEHMQMLCVEPEDSKYLKLIVDCYKFHKLYQQRFYIMNHANGDLADYLAVKLYPGEKKDFDSFCQAQRDYHEAVESKAWTPVSNTPVGLMAYIKRLEKKIRDQRRQLRDYQVYYLKAYRIMTPVQKLDMTLCRNWNKRITGDALVDLQKFLALAAQSGSIGLLSYELGEMLLELKKKYAPAPDQHLDGSNDDEQRINQSR